MTTPAEMPTADVAAMAAIDLAEQVIPLAKVADDPRTPYLDELARRAALWERLDKHAENWLFRLETDANTNVWHCRSAGIELPDHTTVREAVEKALDGEREIDGQQSRLRSSR